MKRLVCLISMLLITGAAQAMIADFENLSLNANSHWSGYYTTDGFGGNLDTCDFRSGSALFENHSDGDWAIWGGFAYSNETDTSTAGFMNQFSSYAGCAQSGTNFAVGYQDAYNGINPVIRFDHSTQLSGLYVTNTTYTALDMLYGNPGFSKRFGGAGGSDQDWLLLTITGKDAMGQSSGAPVEFYLADYRFEDDRLDYIVAAWEYVDLRSLGLVDSLEFSLSSSDNSAWGMNTPAYFAVDTIVPEPAAASLLILGSIMLRMRRNSKRS